MKIIKQGVAPGKVEAELTCRECGCVFQAAKDEFTYKPDSRDGDFWIIICPTEDCGETIYKYNWP